MTIAIQRFVSESNAIEGINRAPTEDEILAHTLFLSLEGVSVRDLRRFVEIIQPDALLRTRPGLNVRVGNHVPIPGGPLVEVILAGLLRRIQMPHSRLTPHAAHCEYETLHPFTDGNGRSGRVLWAWQMLNQGHDFNIGIDRGFLHQFYYQTLAETGR